MKRLLVYFSICFLGASCIKNDIPYPTIFGGFKSFNVEGQKENPEINTDNLTLTVHLLDTVDLTHVKLLSYQLTDCTSINPAPGEYLDLSSQLTFVLSTYQEYTWQVKAEQLIERKFIVKDQIGQSRIDITERSVLAFVPENVSPRNITIEEIQLGPSNSKISPDPSTVTNFTTPQIFTVTYRNITETWKVIVMQTQEVVTTESADAFASIAFFKGFGQSGADNGFEYKKASETNWTKVDPSLISHEGGNFSAKVTGLEPEQSYVCRAYSGSSYGTELPFTTESATPLENASFDNWSTDEKNSKLWYPWGQGASSFWDTGNKGATTMGESNTMPSSDVAPGASGQSAYLSTKFVGIGSLGKLAAGNMFAGEYVKTDGTNGILNFGRSYTSRPLRLKGMYKYKSAPISHTSSNNPDLSALKGQPDTCAMYIALIDSKEPVEIRTKPSVRNLFNPKDPSVIAYAEYYSAENITSWQEFNLELEYRATNRKPTYIVVVFSASKYGDYFTGGDGSVLQLDELKLEFE
ncbi:MAG: PCMD domain-containing protein [Odoribacter sp.]|nr:PCMD domain-containing protein [Odoribacter sp.]